MGDTILVPIELPDPDPLSPVLIDDLSSLDVVVLGHYGLPEQTPVRSAREQFGDEAQATLDEVANAFAEAGATVRTRLVFGKDRTTAIQQVAADEECAAELDPLRPTASTEFSFRFRTWRSSPGFRRSFASSPKTQHSGSRCSTSSKERSLANGASGSLRRPARN